MTKAAVRLLFITGSSILWIFLAVMGLRYVGQQQEFAPWPHPLKSSTWEISKTAIHVPCASLEFNEHIFTWVDVTLAENGDWIIRSTNENLMNCLKSSSDVRLVLNFMAPPHLSLNSAMQVLKERPAESRVILASPFQRVLGQLREELPQYLTAASTAEIGKARLLNGFYLETLATIDADVVWLPRTMPRLINELRRRHKIVLIEEEHNYVMMRSQ